MKCCGAVQFSELMAIRHCIFLMGPTGAGRTEVYRMLARALQTGVPALGPTLCVTALRERPRPRHTPAINCV